MKNLESLSLSALVARFNECAPTTQQVKKFRDKATAIKRVTEMCGKKSAAPAKTAKRSMTEFHSERVSEKRSLKITVLAKDNPKRGTAAARYSLYKNGMTIGKYIELGGQLRDVTWDAKQGWISLS